ncbi:WG repeat-containing protein [Fluviicola sp.]|uniref:WG repeat-containing protein n=1 Tax=Fluviicola sp. TaxID=1917219 RepID=UPI003D2C77CF
MIRFILIGFIIFSSFFSFAQFEEEIDHKAIYNGAYFISKNAAGQYGVITDKGQTKVPFVYSRIIENDWGLFVFKINKSNGFERSYSLGYYDHQFKMVLPCQFNSLLSLEDGLIIGSQNLDKKFGLVDTLAVSSFHLNTTKCLHRPNRSFLLN